ncbi:monocarboxylate transporter 12-like [Saccoglossus kowalevskii]|uniref:Monocarboxylate transporter 12-like n=1 Tax=Saccoglossus kowalevskii TaxID=10224 RepID=A0ABM0GMD3_SACKO|nr:PREDICTED: monocarboxylate transporter 12-like [Saccoglossus kowalevskii]
MSSSTLPKPPDGGYGWFVVIGMFITCYLTAGTFYAFGVLYVAFLDAFGETKAATAWVGSLFALVLVSTGPYSVCLAKNYGHRKTVMLGGCIAATGLMCTSFTTALPQVYLTFGVIAGVGSGLALIPSIEMISIYFSKRFSLALGIAMAGTGAGQFCLAVTSQMLVDTYGWRGLLMLLSGIMLNVCVAGALFRPLSVRCYRTFPANVNARDTHHVGYEETNVDDVAPSSAVANNGTNTKLKTKLKIKEKTNCFRAFLSIYDLTLFKEPVYYLIMLTAIGQSIGHTIVTAHVMRRARDFGIPDVQGALIPAIMGLAQLVGRPIYGAAGNLHYVPSYGLYAFAMAVCGGATALSSYLPSFAGQNIFIVLTGMSLGGYIVLIPVVVSRFLGRKKVAHGISFAYQFHGLAGLAASPTAGWMRDQYGTYEGAFWLASAAYFIGAIAAFLLPVVEKATEKARGDIPKCNKIKNFDDEVLVSEYLSSL